MICQNCHSEVISGNPYCNHCGTKLAPQKSKFCGKCGVQISEGNRFCPNCGDSVSELSHQEARVAPVQYQQVQPATYMPKHDIYVDHNQRHVSQYLNIKKIKTWSAINILLSPLFGIWAYMIVKNIETETNEMIAKQLYKKATKLCVIGSILGLISIIIYSGM